MNIKLDTALGKYRELTKEEFKTLSELISESKKTFEASQRTPRQNRR